MTLPAAVGGDLELDPQLLLRSVAEGRETDLDGVLCDSGRSALAVARRIAEATDDPPELFLLPAYVCESALAPFAGATVALYPVGETLQPDVEAIERLAAGRRACVVVVDYFGFPPAGGVDDLRPRHLVVEDAAGGSLVELAEPAAGRFGDLALTSLRKFAPVPDGAVLRGPLVRPESLPPVDGALVQQRLLAKLLRHELLAGGPPELEAASLALVARHEQAVDAAPVAAMSTLSRQLLAQLDLAAAAERRRTNFEALRDALDGADVVPLHDTLPAGVSPLVFPVRVLD